MPHIPLQILFALLVLFAALYLLVSPRDTTAELKAIFEPRIIRRGTRIQKSSLQFSIRGMMITTTITAMIIALVTFLQFPFKAYLPGLVFLSMFVGMPYLLYRYVRYDLSMNGQRRIQPESYKRSERPRGVMPDIKVVDRRPNENPDVCVNIQTRD